MTACTRLTEIFRSGSERPALSVAGRTLSHGELLAEGQRRADHWHATGLRPGARVMLAPGERSEYLFAVIGGALGGYELVSVSQKATAGEIEHIRRVTRPDLEWRRLPDDSRAAPAPREATFHNVPVTFFTSGTTSLPKGVCHDFETLVANAEAFNRRAGVDATVCMLHVMPTGYMAGLLNTFLSPLIAGGRVVLGEAFDARSALTFWEPALTEDVNAVWLSPTMAATLARLCRDDSVPAWTAAHLRRVFVGTAPLHAATRNAFRDRFGVDCLESYGMTECMFVSVNDPRAPDPGSSVGLLLDGVEAVARDAAGTTLPAGGEGDLWVRSPYSLAGYLDPDSGRPVPALGADGWLDTGDIGIVDAQRRMTITGRRKDLIIHGGTNVSPKAVEDILLAYPGVRDAAVVGVPHPYWGEEVLACLTLEHAATLDEAALRAHCARQLSPDAIPGRFRVLDEFPRSSGGKVQKHLLRAL